MSWWLSLDFAVFHWINSDLSNPVFDLLLPLWREKLTWVPFYTLIVAFIFENFGIRKGMILAIGLLLAVGLSDFTSSELIKKNVHRLRPCNDPIISQQVVIRIPCGSGYSFTSSHAANHFAVAVYLSITLGFISRWITPALLLWAFLVSFSQVYVGVHYPLDVICGGLVGALLGWGVAEAVNQAFGGLK